MPARHQIATRSSHETSQAEPIPAWQIALVLIGFPALYMINSFTPWSRQLFGSNDHDAWFPFWASAFVLHWTSAVIAYVFMRRRGWTLRDVGIALSSRQRIVVLASAVAVGSAAVLVRETFGRMEALGIADLVRAWSAQGVPKSIEERVLWVLMGVITAAFCEEFVYRGFGWHALKSRGLSLPVVAILATLAWIGVHGLGAIFGFPGYALLGVVLGGLLAATGSLVPSLALHAGIHVFVILGS